MQILIALTVLGMITLLGGILNYKKILLPLIAVGCSVAVYFLVDGWNKNVSVLNHMMLVDNFSIVFSVLLIALTFFVLFLYNQLIGSSEHHEAEVYSIFIFALVGAVVMVSFTNMLMLFLGIEILSLSMYILAGIKKRNLLSNEAALKYFLMGAFSTGFLLFGIALIYGETASFDVQTIGEFVAANANQLPLFFYAGIIMLLVGLLFKVAAVPFQFWTPDVYEGAPTLVTAFMATIGKIAAFAAFYRLFSFSFEGAGNEYTSLLMIVSAATMTVGNLMALKQNNVKRMLAYSSIAHAGYMLMAVLSMNSMSATSIFYYSVAYGLASVCTFAIVFIAEEKMGDASLHHFAGFAKQNKLLAIVFAIALLSLSGIPVTAGFFGKFYLFSTAIQNHYIWLVVVGVINSFVGVYYYFAPIIQSYMHSGNEEVFKTTSSVKWFLVFITICSLLAGVFPGVITGLL